MPVCTQHPSGSVPEKPALAMQRTAELNNLPLTRVLKPQNQEIRKLPGLQRPNIYTSEEGLRDQCW